MAVSKALKVHYPTTDAPIGGTQKVLCGREVPPTQCVDPSKPVWNGTRLLRADARRRHYAQKATCVLCSKRAATA